MADDVDKNEITIEDFTTETVDGTGVFDVMTRSILAHLKAEFKAGRITGPEYATVYLGALQGTQDRALQFLLSKDEQSYKLQLLEIELDKAELEKDKIEAEIKLIEANTKKIDAEVVLVEAQADLIPLEKEKLEAEVSLIEAQVEKLNREDDLIQAQVRKIDSDITVNTSEIQVNDAQIAKLEEDAKLIAAQISKMAEEEQLISAQITKLGKESLNVEADTALVAAKTVNVPLEGNVLTANECKLKAEYDVLLKQKGKVDSETAVLNQKQVTEKAQTDGTGVSAASIVGRQMGLYKAQADGFVRDAEQKAAKIMADTWNVRRTTDESVVADGINKLSDVNIGKAISQLLSGIGQTASATSADFSEKE